MLSPTAWRNSGIVFWPRRNWSQFVFRRFCSLLVSLLTCRTSGSPSLILSSSVSADNWSIWIHWIVCHRPGCLCPTSRLKPLFQDSQMLFVRCPSSTVVWWTFQVTSGNLGSPVLLIRNMPPTIRDLNGPDVRWVEGGGNHPTHLIWTGGGGGGMSRGGNVLC